jgi:hypothetical protein
MILLKKIEGSKERNGISLCIFLDKRKHTHTKKKLSENSNEKRFYICNIIFFVGWMRMYDIRCCVCCAEGNMNMITKWK